MHNKWAIFGVKCLFVVKKLPAAGRALKEELCTAETQCIAAVRMVALRPSVQ
jgi:hypothetical protein